MDRKRIALIFPHQLFKSHPAIKETGEVYLIEELLFFNQYNFNKKKLVLHRASMQWYRDYLQQKGITVHYIDATDSRSDLRLLIPSLAEQGVSHIHYVEVTDNWLQRRLQKAGEQAGITLIKRP